MDPADAYLLDLCDAAIGEPAQRGAALPWLLEGADPGGAPARVDGWYPGARIVVLLTEGRRDERALTLAGVAEGYGVDVFELPRHGAKLDADGRPRRLPGEAEAIQRLLGDPERRRWERVEPDHGFTTYAPVDHDDDDHDHDDHASDDSDEDWSDEDDELEEEEREVDISEVMGWRGRAVMLALLEALRLSRRGFTTAVAGEGLSERALEALLVLAAVEPPATPVEPAHVASVLDREAYEVARALDELREAGHATPLGERVMGSGRIVLGEDVEWDWVLTAAGRDAALRWIARAVTLFEGWPPDTPGADDAVDAPPEP